MKTKRLHGSVSHVLVPGYEAETESETCRIARKRAGIAVPKKKQIWKRDGNDESYLEAFKFDIGIVNKNKKRKN